MSGKIKKDLTGERFGRRIVIGRALNRKNHVYWNVVCDCGYTSEVLRQSLEKSSGCRWCSHKEDRPYRRLRPYEAQYNIFKSRARFLIEISYEQFAILAEQKQCHYCDAEIIWSEYRRADKRGGSGSNLDRKDYKQGYSLNNVVVCCGRCNYAKGTHFSYKEWKVIGSVIKKLPKSKKQPITPQSGRSLANLEKELENDKKTI